MRIAATTAIVSTVSQTPFTMLDDIRTNDNYPSLPVGTGGLCSVSEFSMRDKKKGR
jgi:hypothetical protein